MSLSRFNVELKIIKIQMYILKTSVADDEKNIIVLKNLETRRQTNNFIDI